MFVYIIRRLLLMFPTLIGVTMVVFFVMALSPGGVGGMTDLGAEGEMDSRTREAMRQYYNDRYGLDQPLVVQYVRWLNRVSPIGFKEAQQGWPGWRIGFKVPDLGESYSRRRPVLTLFMEALPITLLLNLIATPIVYLIAVPAGLYMARHRGRDADILSGVSFLALWSIPVIWAGVMLIGYLANRQYLYLFPTSGISSTMAAEMAFLPETGRGWLAVAGFSFYLILLGVALLAVVLTAMTLISAIRQFWLHRQLSAARGALLSFVASLVTALVAIVLARYAMLPSEMPDDRGWLFDRGWHLILPTICMVYAGFAFLSKLMRGAVLENLSSHYVRTARAKGVREHDVLWRHAFRNSLLPLITVAAGILPGLLGGSVIIESIFSIPGMGLLTLEAIFARDRELVLAGVLVGGLLGLFCILLADIAYAIADPRVSYE